MYAALKLLCPGLACKRLLCLAASLFAASLLHAQATPPATPAGEALAAYLHAMNSADRSEAQAYVSKYQPTESADGILGFAAQTGGFDLVSIETSTPTDLFFRVRGRSDHLEAVGTLHLATVDPPRVDSLSIRLIPPGATVENITLDAASRQRTIDAISHQLTDFYVFPDVAAQMIAAIKQHAQHGDYNTLTNGSLFADRLTNDLRAVSHDRHLFVGYDPFLRPADPAGAGPHVPSAEETARFRLEVQHDNCAFKKVEILPRNIGYLSLDAFGPPEFCAPTATAAMDFLAHTDALIVDLRNNHGGDPSMVQFLASFLFASSTHINDLVNRHNNETHQYWTLPSVPGSRFLDKPVFVLTSHRTFSGGEEFTYDLQTQKRATIVGETTGGGAHPMSVMPAGPHFSIGVPEGRPINPVTHKDWEGTGVTPDVSVAADDALTTAQKLATERLDTGNQAPAPAVPAASAPAAPAPAPPAPAPPAQPQA